MNTNVISLAENQDEVRCMQLLRRTFENMPPHKVRAVLIELAKQYPEFKIKINGEAIEP